VTGRVATARIETDFSTVPVRGQVEGIVRSLSL
jgi:hypothetical protein